MASEVKPRPKYYCTKCGQQYHFQVHRNWIVKQLGFILPVKKYFCAKCKREEYVFVKSQPGQLAK